jgi:hypothetical protein
MDQGSESINHDVQLLTQLHIMINALRPQTMTPYNALRPQTTHIIINAL